MNIETTIADQETLARQEAAVAALILLRSQKSLPYPQFRIYPDEQVSLEFGPIAELEAWAGALQGLGAAEGKLRTGVMHGSDRPYHFMNMDGWLCRVTLRAYEQRPEPTPPLDADTVAALEAVAGKQSDHVPAERVDAILAELNRITTDGDNWWDWIHIVPEFDREATASCDGGGVHLVDGTELIWHEYAKSWTVAGGSR